MHRRHQAVKDLEGESDIDEEFQLGVDQAAGKFGRKRRKKHLFNDAGVPIEPFNLENDIKEGYLTREGVFKMQREMQKAKEEEEEERDEWYESIRGEQAQMLFDKSRQQQDSDASESEDEAADSQEERQEEAAENVDQKAVASETLALKRRLIELLEGNENANEALRRHRGNQDIVQRKKNVRKAVAAGETSKPQ